MNPHLQDQSFLDLTPIEQEQRFRELGIPAFRLKQVRGWLYARKEDRPEKMTNLSKELRALLLSQFSRNGNGSLFSGHFVHETISQDETRKLLIELADGHQIECVLLRDERNHRTGCISTQVGCAMNCVFCASGLDGFVRNLSRGEILEQVLRLNQLLPSPERLTHLVIMGTGEPLLNLDSLLSALEEVIAGDGLDLSARRVTISTVGIPQGILKLSESGHPYKLAISLHAPNDEIRSEIVPQNRFSGIRAILDSAEKYHRKSGRRITFEYVLIRGVNDQAEQARELARLLQHQTAVVNVIPFNPVEELSWKTPSSKTTEQFVRILRDQGIAVKIRFRKGDRIDAACGQLRRRFRKEQSIEV